jgi:molecular chaperone DnaK
MTKIIERNTTIPIRKSQIFTTAEDMQTSVEIHVLQGERALAKDNVSLGRFTLTGIPPAPRGVPQIEVTFDIDANGILHVTAKDKATGKEQSMKIVAPNKMSREEIEQKMKEAEKYAEEDRKIREFIELKNTAESLIYTEERTLKDSKDKISKETADEVEKAKNELQEAIKKEDKDEISSKMESLKSALEKLGEELYKGQGQAQGGASGGGPGFGPSSSFGSGPDNQGNTTDADFRVEK